MVHPEAIPAEATEEDLEPLLSQHSRASGFRTLFQGESRWPKGERRYAHSWVRGWGWD